MSVPANYIIRAQGARTSALPSFTSPSFLSEVWRFVNDLIGFGGNMPAGMIVAWGGGLAPSGWLLCDGSTIERKAFPRLFEAIGTTYGSGDGATTFAVPDYRSSAPVGEANPPSVTVSGGAAVPVVTPTPTPTPVPPPVAGGTGGQVVVGGRPPNFVNPGEFER